jgi:hypothetical protein
MKTLIQTNDRSIRDWTQWKELWDKADVAEVRHSLLHFGFAIEIDHGESRERIKTYLSIADGWNAHRHEHFATADEQESWEFKNLSPSRRKDPWHLRAQMARKAFEVLCLQIFKKLEEKPGQEHWSNYLHDPVVLKELLAFFLLPSIMPWGGQPRNFPEESRVDHHSDVAFRFLNKLVEYYWLERDDLPREVIGLYPEIRVTLIDILHHLGRPGFVWQRGNRNDLDDACLARMHEIALAQEHYVPQEDVHRRPKDIGEAAYFGSGEAEVLLLLKNFHRQKSRMDRIKLLRSKVDDATRSLERLTT